MRIYWYDAAPHAVPTQEQLAIADLPNVKLRLGRLVDKKQKGVDSLIVRDLMTLARERAVATVFLLGGDEDLREGVVAAQEMGVLVVVIGIPITGQGNQAKSLIREADEHIMLDAGFLSPFFSSVEAAVPAFQAGEEVGDQGWRAGHSFANTWARLATSSEIRALLAQAPVIPMPLDVQLILDAENILGSLRGREDLKKNLRAGFWSALKEIVKLLPQPEP